MESVEEYSGERSPKASLKLMFLEDNGKDFKFTVGRESVMVHKLILIYRCEYFQRMLQHDTVEKDKNEVIIEDFDLETVKSFVRYLYTDEIEESELFEELLILADKYCMLELKIKCEKLVLKKVNETTAIDLLIIADKYNCHLLKRKALVTIRDNIKTIRSSEGYEKLQELSHLKDSIIDLFSEAGTSSGCRIRINDSSLENFEQLDPRDPVMMVPSVLGYYSNDYHQYPGHHARPRPRH